MGKAYLHSGLLLITVVVLAYSMAGILTVILIVALSLAGGAVVFYKRSRHAPEHMSLSEKWGPRRRSDSHANSSMPTNAEPNGGVSRWQR